MIYLVYALVEVYPLFGDCTFLIALEFLTFVLGVNSHEFLCTKFDTKWTMGKIDICPHLPIDIFDVLIWTKNKS